MNFNFTQSELNAMTERQLNALLQEAITALADQPPSSEEYERAQAMLLHIRVALYSKRKMRRPNLTF
ncbi:MAG: hypothetical protein ABL962_22130 [Fimbriimonadaceae bacterium]